MATNGSTSAQGGFGLLRQFARRRRDVEHCELCSLELGADHAHLFDPAHRKLVCACDPCALLFAGRADARFKQVPRRVRMLANFQMTDAQWDSLMIPINMAFFFRSSIQQKMVAMYPSPAGATESLLSLESWQEIEQQNPELKKLQPDVEALLVNRVAYARGAEEPEYYLLPIDACYKLVGLIRSQWHGFSGGTDVWRSIAQFFDELKSKATVVKGTAHA